MSRTVVYTVYLEVSDEAYADGTYKWMNDISDAFRKLPGFIESDFQDSYSD